MKERYPIEQRTRVPFRNEEWHALAGRENRYPGQFGQAEEPSENQSTEIQGTSNVPDVVRPQIFPYETAEGIK